MTLHCERILASNPKTNSPSNCSHGRKNLFFFQFVRPQHQGMSRASIGVVVWKDIIQVFGEHREAHLGNVVEGLGAVFVGVLKLIHVVGVPARIKVIDLVSGSGKGSSRNRWKVSTMSICSGCNPQKSHVCIKKDRSRK